MKNVVLTVTVVIVGVLSVGCASQSPVKLAGSCAADPTNFVPVHVTIKYDAADTVSDITPVPEEVKIKYYGDPKKTKEGQVCWIFEPVDTNNAPTALKTDVFFYDKHSDSPFAWTIKKKLKSGALEIASDVPKTYTTAKGWEYKIKSGDLELDPKIIVIDASH